MVLLVTLLVSPINVLQQRDWQVYNLNKLLFNFWFLLLHRTTFLGLDSIGRYITNDTSIQVKSHMLHSWHKTKCTAQSPVIKQIVDNEWYDFMIMKGKCRYNNDLLIIIPLIFYYLYIQQILIKPTIVIIGVALHGIKVS